MRYWEQHNSFGFCGIAVARLPHLGAKTTQSFSIRTIDSQKVGSLLHRLKKLADTRSDPPAQLRLSPWWQDAWA
jgi:hypothetical protein